MPPRTRSASSRPSRAAHARQRWTISPASMTSSRCSVKVWSASSTTWSPGSPTPSRSTPSSCAPVSPTSASARSSTSDPHEPTAPPAEEALMDDKLQPPAPAVEITPAEPVEEVSEDKAVSILSDLPDEQRRELESRADAWLDEVSALNPHSQEFTAQVNALGAVARRTFEIGRAACREREKSRREAVREEKDEARA